jgi:hypothetical protein
LSFCSSSLNIHNKTAGKGLSEANGYGFSAKLISITMIVRCKEKAIEKESFRFDIPEHPLDSSGKESQSIRKKGYHYKVYPVKEVMTRG